jgi:hypothetical protein
MRYGGRPSSVLDVTIKEGHAHELAKSIALSLLAGSVIGSITIDIFPAR